MTETWWDRNSELATLAACLASQVARDETRRHIAGKDFHDPLHEDVWDAMARLDRARRPVDPSTMLAVLQGNRRAIELLPRLVTWPAIPEHVADYANTVRGWAVKRRLNSAAVEVQQLASKTETDPVGLAASVATKFAALRDYGVAEDAQSITLGELLAEPDDEPDWAIPGLLERRDRLILTGEEGLGKSYLLRQIGVMAAAGLNPFDPGKHLPPLSVLVIDCENSLGQVRRKTRRLADYARRYGQRAPDMLNLWCSTRVDVTRDKDLASIHREVDACQPDLLVIGPLYRLTTRAIQTDDEAVPVLAAIDGLRDKGCAVLVEAHAGHAIGKGGLRDLRPRGSSALLGWPEFGYGMRLVERGVADFVPWRGDRDERDWPRRMRRCQDNLRWIPEVDDYQGGWQ